MNTQQSPVQPAIKPTVESETQANTEAMDAANARQTAKAVLWSFFGVRKMASLQNDMTSLKPRQILLTALLGAGLFIATLLSLVKLAIYILTP